MRRLWLLVSLHWLFSILHCFFYVFNFFLNEKLYYQDLRSQFLRYRIINQISQDQLIINQISMDNPFLIFCEDFNEAIVPVNKQQEQKMEVEQHKEVEQHNTSSLAELRIRRRRISHPRNFGRGANHPSFFLRKFFSKLALERYQKVYEDDPDIFERVLQKGRKLKAQKSRFKLQDLDDTFGRRLDAKESYLNAKMFFKAISEQSLEMITEESRCSQVLNHLISIEKYSSRLANPHLTARVEFQ